MARKPAPRIGAFREALRYFRSLTPRTEDTVDRLDDQEQDRSFTLAGVAQLDLVTMVWRALDRAIAQGTSFADFKRKVSLELTDAWGGEKPYRVETIFRTNVQTAYNAGRWEQMTSPETKEFRPYFRYLAILDTRTTVLICRPIANTVLPQSDPFWGTHWPPLHFSCRSTVMAITVEQADSSGVTVHPSKTSAQEGFGRTPDKRGYTPDFSSAPPQLVHALKTR